MSEKQQLLDASPGKILEAERIAHNWSQQEISDQINLNVSIIGHLEADDYDKLPPPIFIKGYIRCYSKLLEIDPEPLINAYNQREYQDPVIGRIADVKAEAASSDPIIKAVSYVVVAAILAAVVFWWYNNQAKLNRLDKPINSQIQENSSEFAIENDSESVAVGGAIIEPVVVGLSEQRLTSNNSDFSSATREDSGRAASEAIIISGVNVDPQKGSIILQNEDSFSQTSAFIDSEPSFSSKDLSGISQETANSEKIAVVEKQGNSNNESEQLPTLEVGILTDKSNQSTQLNKNIDSDEVEVADSILKKDILLLSAQEESWVSVIDATEKRLMYGILTSGTPRKLLGRAPFNVVFGAASSIDVTLNGRSVEFSSMIRKSKTARFIIDPDGKSHR